MEFQSYCGLRVRRVSCMGDSCVGSASAYEWLLGPQELSVDLDFVLILPSSWLYAPILWLYFILIVQTFNDEDVYSEWS